MVMVLNISLGALILLLFFKVLWVFLKTLGAILAVSSKSIPTCQLADECMFNINHLFSAACTNQFIRTKHLLSSDLGKSK